MVPRLDGGKLQAILDLGVIVQDDLKCAKQWAKVVGTANKVLGMIKRTFGNFSKEIIFKLYKSDQATLGICGAGLEATFAKGCKFA